jgi:GGDEF domain-containing protein
MVERIQKAVADCLLDTPKPRTVQLTVSAGLAIFPQDATNATDLLVAADQALYREKENE